MFSISTPKFPNKKEQQLFDISWEQHERSSREFYQQLGHTEAQIQAELAQEELPAFIERFELTKAQQLLIIQMAKILKRHGYTEEFLKSSLNKIDSTTVTKEEIEPLVLEVKMRVEQKPLPTAEQLLALFEPYMNRKERLEQAIREETQRANAEEQRANAMARKRIAEEQRANAAKQERLLLEKQLEEDNKEIERLKAALREANTRNAEQSLVTNSPAMEIHKKRNAGEWFEEKENEGNSHDEVQKSDSPPKKHKPSNESPIEKLKEGLFSLFSHKQHAEEPVSERNDNKKGQGYKP